MELQSAANIIEDLAPATPPRSHKMPSHTITGQSYKLSARYAAIVQQVVLAPRSAHQARAVKPQDATQPTEP